MTSEGFTNILLMVRCWNTLNQSCFWAWINTISEYFLDNFFVLDIWGYRVGRVRSGITSCCSISTCSITRSSIGCGILNESWVYSMGKYLFDYLFVLDVGGLGMSVVWRGGGVGWGSGRIGCILLREVLSGVYGVLEHLVDYFLFLSWVRNILWKFWSFIHFWSIFSC